MIKLKELLKNILENTTSPLSIYPVGSIYMSVNSTSPQTLFGGTWEQIQNRFLLAAGSSYSAGSTGGASSVTLTAAQSGLPSHNHLGYGWAAVADGGGSYVVIGWHDTSNPRTSYVASTGGWNASQAHNNMPPYLAVYVWKRTA